LTGDWAAQQTRFRPGSELGGYQLEAEVGAGGMAVVFRARDERLDRLVAVKILNPVHASDPSFRRRFIAESRAAASVESPYIIPVYTADEAAGVLFIAMRYVHSGDLRRVLEGAGPLPPERALEYIVPVASALDAAHAAGLVHRDVKPGNILVDTRPGQPEHVYLSDFGIAKSDFLPALTMTEPGVILGTPEYAAPEQIEVRALDGRADQYALGCVAYWLLTGEAPFHGGNTIAVFTAHLYEPPPPLTARRPDLPAAADEVLARAMAKVPDQRYASCGDFAAALGDALGIVSSRSGGRRGPGPARPVGQTPTARDPVPRPRARPDGSPTPSADPATAPLTAVTPTAGADAGANADGRYRAKQDPAGQAAGPPPTARRRRRLPLLVRVGGPAALIAVAAAVIAVAVSRHDGTVGSAANTTQATGASFAGYPGQQGNVRVHSIAAAGGSLAVGSADGHPAVWRRAAGGSWRLATSVPSAVAALPGTFDSIAHGADGWIAVGNTHPTGGTGQPVVVTSADGVHWQVSSATFPGPGPVVSGVAAGPDGYVVVGRHVDGTVVYAAMWWSADLSGWSQADNDATGSGLNGGQHPSVVNAVTAAPGGFVATGAWGGDYVIWTAGASGQQWTFHPMTPPLPATAAALGPVTVNGNGVEVAGGNAVVNGGNVPIVAVSTDDGQRWDLVRLTVPGGHGTVNALTETGAGFVVAGQAGSSADPRALTWSLPTPVSPSGWSKVAPDGGDVSKITAMTAMGSAVTGAAERGQAAPVVTVPAP
jgi:Protein kinase domain